VDTVGGDPANSTVVLIDAYSERHKELEVPMFLDETEQRKLDETWRILAETIPQLEFDGFCQSFSVNILFEASSCERLATYFIACFQKEYVTFLSDTHLHEIATEPMVARRERLERNIPKVAGIYIFVSLAEGDKKVLKVGESRDMQDRITNGHLRYGNSHPESSLIDSFESQGIIWPNCIQDLEITLLLFPMHGSETEERRVIELGLKRLLVSELT
jgi:hypothetical protein